MSPYKQLTDADVDHFLAHGYIKLKDCFTREQAAEITENVWTRLGMSPTDKSTWTSERINMPGHKEMDVSVFAPKAWDAICDLVGGAERISAENRNWRDSLIVNLGTPQGDGKDIPPQKLPGWHVDGDFFVHYLDSPEQGLLVILLFTDIAPSAGGTMICPPAIGTVARHLYEHPEGVSPRMTPREQNPKFVQEKGLTWFNDLAASFGDDAFVEASGEIGDVYLLHPLMLHSASNNKLRIPRIITNPPVSLVSPFIFDRENESEYSLVEKKTLKELGEGSLKGWKITEERQRVVPERVRIQEAMKARELERLKAIAAAA